MSIMNRTIFLAGLSGYLIGFSLIYPQSQNLQPIESYAFSQSEAFVTARDNSIGLLDNRPSLEALFREFLLNGPDVNHYDMDIYRLLEIKHDLFSSLVDTDIQIRLSIVTEKENSMESRFLITGYTYKLKGTMYLTRWEGKWFLSDVELEN